jgi:hypothetical protein
LYPYRCTGEQPIIFFCGNKKAWVSGCMYINTWNSSYYMFSYIF